MYFYKAPTNQKEPHWRNTPGKTTNQHLTLTRPDYAKQESKTTLYMEHGTTILTVSDLGKRLLGQSPTSTQRPAPRGSLYPFSWVQKCPDRVYSWLSHLINWGCLSLKHSIIPFPHIKYTVAPKDPFITLNLNPSCCTCWIKYAITSDRW